MIRLKIITLHIKNILTSKEIKNITKSCFRNNIKPVFPQKQSFLNNKISKIYSKTFTFKYSNDTDTTEKIELKYIRKVNENIDEIIKKFIKHKLISSIDIDYFIENCVFYNYENDKEKLKIILNILCFLIKSSERRIEIKNNSNTKLNKLYRIIVKNNKDLLSCLDDYLDLKNDYEKFNITFSNIKFFISDLIDEFIKLNIDKANEYNKILFIINNYKSIIKLIELPFFKKRIGLFITNILSEFKTFYDSTINKSQEKDVLSDQLGYYNNLFSNQFQELFYIFYYTIEYRIRVSTEEIFIKRFKAELSQVSQGNEDQRNNFKLDLNFPFLMLYKVDFLNSYSPLKNKRLSFSNVRLFKEHLKYIDNYLDVIIDHFTKNFNDVYFILKFFDKISKILMFRDKSSVTDIREFTNIMLYLNYSLDHYINELKEKDLTEKKEQGKFF